MNQSELDLIHQFLNGTLSEEAMPHLQSLLRESAEARKMLRDLSTVDTKLNELAAANPTTLHLLAPAALEKTQDAKRSSHFTSTFWRPLTAAAAGLAFGLFSASIVWAISSPKATTERLFSLINGSFEENRLETGFPRQTSVWSGDEAAITPDGTLRFIAPGSDANDPSARAISCDVFQLVDLRPLRQTLNNEGNSVLELSAKFRDSRPTDVKTSVTFFCQLYLFQGEPAALHQSWPQCIPEALSTGSAQITTLGSLNAEWKPLTAKCLVPPSADFAVVQIAARPNLRPTKLENIFADDVELTLKTSPELPIRTVQR
ncbi:MAG: hypothetical protein RL693_2815 [Verrucomicrobiota bacterium]|jgi:hypothetical protein